MPGGTPSLPPSLTLASEVVVPGCAWWGQGLPAALLGETSEVGTRASKHTHFLLLGEPCPSLGVTHSLSAQGYHARMGKPRSGGRRELGQVAQLPLRGRGGRKVKAWDSERGAPLNPSGPTWVLEDLTPSQWGLLRLGSHLSPVTHSRPPFWVPFPPPGKRRMYWPGTSRLRGALREPPGDGDPPPRGMGLRLVCPESDGGKAAERTGLIRPLDVVLCLAEEERSATVKRMDEASDELDNRQTRYRSQTAGRTVQSTRRGRRGALSSGEGWAQACREDGRELGRRKRSLGDSLASRGAHSAGGGDLLPPGLPLARGGDRGV